MKATTPAGITEQVRRFADSLVPGAAPVRVQFAAMTPPGVVDECYENVGAVVRSSGGQALLGWTIWEAPGVFLEATFHAVWRGDDGELLDPTPKADGELITLFVPDPNAVDAGGVTPSRHWPLADWKEVADYIDVCRKIDELKREYHPDVCEAPEEITASLFDRKKQLTDAIDRLQYRETAFEKLLIGVTLSEAEAVGRLSASAADVEASIALARHSAARGDFASAFATLIEVAELGVRQATGVRDTFLVLFNSCGDEALVSDFRRRLTMLLYR